MAGNLLSPAMHVVATSGLALGSMAEVVADALRQLHPATEDFSNTERAELLAFIAELSAAWQTDAPPASCRGGGGRRRCSWQQHQPAVAATALAVAFLLLTATSLLQLPARRRGNSRRGRAKLFLLLLLIQTIIIMPLPLSCVTHELLQQTLQRSPLVPHITVASLRQPAVKLHRPVPTARQQRR